MRHDQQAYISLARDRIRQIEAVMLKDLGERPHPKDDAWDLAAAMRKMEAEPADDDPVEPDAAPAETDRA